MFKMFFLFALLLAVVPARATTLLSEKFNGVDSTCWASRPNAAGTENWAGCGTNPLWAPIAEPAYADTLAIFRAYPHSPYAHSSPEAVAVTWADDEALAYAQFNLTEDHLFVTQWMLFDTGFDFPFGLKAGRIDMWDSTNDVSYSSFIVVISAATSTDYGTDNMGSITFARNGGENFGYAEGISFTRGVWYKVAYEIKLNSIGSSNGEARLWVNDSLVLSRTGMGGTDLRPSGDPGYHLSFFRLGGWYSNSGKSPVPPTARLYLDDICISNSARCEVSTSTTPWWKFWKRGNGGFHNHHGGSR